MKEVMCLRENGEVLFHRILRASFVWDRMKGLMFKDNLDHGLLIDNCNSIHTFFMKVPIDVIFLNSKNKVVKIYHEVPPWRVTRFVWGSTHVIELPAGEASKKGVVKGERLRIECTS